MFNSYYESKGERISRARRGVLSRPTVKEVFLYRNYVDDNVCKLIESIKEGQQDISNLILLGVHHEMQHQELLLTDIKHIFATNHLRPVYSQRKSINDSKVCILPLSYEFFKGSLVEIGHGREDFAFDNERPPHKVFINDFKLQKRLVTNGEYLEFMNDGGYLKHWFWLSDGWDIVQKEKWISPLYWENNDGEWFLMTLSGLQKLNMNEPVCHVSYYEADAYARWMKKRLPTEAEWEYAASLFNIDLDNSNLLEMGDFHPKPLSYDLEKLTYQMLGDTWEWTQSSYSPYPGYMRPEDALGEYNGKFMCNQMVLRGGSCVTPKSHIRTTYRNFFQCDKRWQFSGIRLAEDA